MPWKFFPKETPFFVQGITGREGSRMTKWLCRSGARVVAGVTPGKAGECVQGLLVFGSVSAAKECFPEVEVSTIVVPAPRVVAAVEEALDAGIRFLHILTEQVPVHDTLCMRRLADQVGACILGPSSVGYLQFPAFRLGYLGGEDPWPYLSEGRVAIVSMSGGMANELLMGLARARVGVRCVFSVGGDRFPLFSVEEAVRFCEEQSTVDCIILFLEPGCPWLHQLIRGEVSLKKRVIMFFVGDVLDELPRGMPYGHTGTLLGEGARSVHDLRMALIRAGYACVDGLEDCVRLCQ